MLEVVVLRVVPKVRDVKAPNFVDRVVDTEIDLDKVFGRRCKSNLVASTPEAMIAIC